MQSAILFFDDERAAAGRLASACGVPALQVERHRFPDGELRLRLPVDACGKLPERLILYRSLADPNEKLLELLLIAGQARGYGARELVLVAPYLAYMRQDIAFRPGEVVSQKVVGALLGQAFDAVLTVDPHLHRIDRLEQAIPHTRCFSLSGAPLLGALIAREIERPLLLGPDGEAAQWVALAAQAQGFENGVCSKQRQGDRQVQISLPRLDFAGRHVVLIDDVASSGHTLAEAARLVLAAGAAQVDVAVTHALFAADALALVHAAGVQRVWSSDCIAHPSNALQVAPLLAATLREALLLG